MDRLTIFPQATSEVSFKTEESNTIDTVVTRLKDVERELKLTRKGHEAWTWGDEVEDSEDIDLEDMEE